MEQEGKAKGKKHIPLFNLGIKHLSSHLEKGSSADYQNQHMKKVRLFPTLIP